MPERIHRVETGRKEGENIGLKYISHVVNAVKEEGGVLCGGENGKD